MVHFIVGGVIIVVGALVAIFVRQRFINKGIEIAYMKTTSIPDLLKDLKTNADAGLENYRQYAELKGIAEADNTVAAPYSNQNVAYYEAEIHQVFEENETYTDSEGHVQQRMKRTEELMSATKSPGPVVIKDAESGEKVYAELLSTGMQLDTVQSFSKFEPLNSMQQYGFFNSFQYRPMGLRTLGFRMEEKIIPLGQQLYALGDAYLQGGKLYLSKPADKKKPYILSVKNEADLLQGSKTGSVVSLVAGIVIAVIGAAVMVFVQ